MAQTGRFTFSDELGFRKIIVQLVFIMRNSSFYNFSFEKTYTKLMWIKKVLFVWNKYALRMGQR